MLENGYELQAHYAQHVLGASVSVYLSLCLHNYPSIHLSIFLSIYLSIYLLFIYLSMYLVQDVRQD